MTEKNTCGSFVVVVVCVWLAQLAKRPFRLLTPFLVFYQEFLS